MIDNTKGVADFISEWKVQKRLEIEDILEKRPEYDEFNHIVDDYTQK